MVDIGKVLIAAQSDRAGPRIRANSLSFLVADIGKAPHPMTDKGAVSSQKSERKRPRAEGLGYCVLLHTRWALERTCSPASFVDPLSVPSF